tara:strand:+ start:207 stop:1076 length:870 start_codon:yes stop_codon:yes gene_type:complete
MVNIAKPTLTTYGNTAGVFGGVNILDHKPPVEFDTSILNRRTLNDSGEFSEFETQIKDFILGRLGHPVVRVELTSHQIKTCIDEAKTKISYHAPLWTRQFAVFNCTAGVNLYELPPYILHNLEYVVYKKTLLSIQSQAGTLEFDFFIKYFQDNFVFKNFDIAEFYLLQQHLEQMRKILSQEGSWDVIDNRWLQIQPTPVTTNQQVILEFRTLNSETLHPQYLNWIQKYATALAKQILGEVRSKYKTLPGPGGGAQLNGNELKQEAKAELEILEEALLTEIEEPAAFTMF